MNKIFLFAKHAKTGEDCKSRRKCLIGSINLIRRSLEFFAFAKNRDDSLLFSASPRTRFLAKTPVTLTLAVVLSMGLISESNAGCNFTNDNGEAVNESGNYCGTCGTNCNWELENGNMKITGGANGEVGTMDDYSVSDDGKSGNTPWWNYKSLIRSVDVQGVENIGKHAFKMVQQVNKVDIGEGIKTVGEAAFYSTTISSLYVPDSVEKIEWAAFFSFISSLQVSLPDTVTGLSGRVFGDVPYYVNIICRGNAESCINVQSQLDSYRYYDHTRKEWDTVDISGNVAPANNEEQCNGQNHYWSGVSCNNKKYGINCAENFRQMEDWCNRIRYTPTDAAKVLKDTDNEIVMTFKVNR